MRQVHLRILGSVQGVGFRFLAKREAERLGINGWIRNRADGTVEAVGCGLAERVEVFVQWCKNGPSGSRVESVELLPDVEECQFRDFQILHDY